LRKGTEIRGERAGEGCSDCWGETHHHPDSAVAKTILGVKLIPAPLEKKSGLIIGSWPTVSSSSSGGGSKNPDGPPS